MKVIEVKKTCAVCGKESTHKQLMSNFISGSPDLDLKPNGSMSALGAELQMCPHCFYCNYDVSEQFDPKCELTIESWQNNEDIKELLGRNYNDTVKKYYIMAIQYFNVEEYDKSYKMLISASWAADSDDMKINIMNEASEIFQEYVMPYRVNQLFQLVDIKRQCGEFDEARQLLDACNKLLFKNIANYDILKKVSAFESELISKKDSSRHNMSELS